MRKKSYKKLINKGYTMSKKIFLIIILFFPFYVQASDLREKIPTNALAYMRIPNPWTMFSLPKDTVLKGALANQENLKQVQKLKTAISANLIKQQKLFHPVFTILNNHLLSPIEAVVLAPENAPPILANLLLSTKLNIDSIDAMNQVLKQLAAKTPKLTMATEVSAAGDGILMIKGMPPLFLHYDLSSKTLYIMVGMSANQLQLKQTISALTPIKEHPMYDIENRIDSGHNGYFTWINLQNILPFVKIVMPPKKALPLEKLGLFDAKALAWGWGVRDNKARLTLIMDTPKAGYGKLLPTISNNFSVTAAGKPNTVLSLSLPLFESLQGFENILTKEADAKTQKKYQDFKQQFQTDMGFSIEDALQAYGSETIFFTDELGQFLAIKVGDQNKLDHILKIFQEKHKLYYAKRDINNKTYHHLKTPVLASFDKKDTLKGFIFDKLSKLKTHYFWTQENDYLIFAQIPQFLRDRHQYKAQTQIKDWLKNEQHQDSTSSLFLASTQIDGSPGMIYHAYLQILNMMSDLYDGEIDLFKLPSAMDLNLPKQGTYGFQIDFSDSGFGVELTFENNPFDFMFTYDLSYMVMLGVASAVITPALMKKIR
jgi:hypothetical protein